MNRRFLYGITAMAVTAVVASGCAREDQPTPIAGNNTAVQPAVLDDDQLATYVQARFQAEPAIRASDINVSTNNGVVTLRGTVASEQARQQALSTARQVNGVTLVEDQLQVSQDTGRAAGPVARTGQENTSPAWITTKIQAQFFTSGDVRPWNVDVTTAEGGVVTLQGEVANARAREEAERIARSTDGVTRVVNNLRVNAEARAEAREERAETATTAADDRRKAEPAGAETAPTAAAERPDREPEIDPWVTAKIQAKYFMDDEVKGRNINVDTREGAVTLTGEVANEGERRQAVALARNTDGVRSVNDQLRIQPQPGDAPAGGGQREGERSATQAVDDGWLTTKVQSKFFLEPDVKGRAIDVDTRQGVVTLTGTVTSDAEKLLAGTIAGQTEGVTRVVNQIKVEAVPPQR